MEKYIFLDFDGVLNTPKGKFDQKAIGTNRHFLMIQNSLHQLVGGIKNRLKISVFYGEKVVHLADI